MSRRCRVFAQIPPKTAKFYVPEDALTFPQLASAKQLAFEQLDEAFHRGLGMRRPYMTIRAAVVIYCPEKWCRWKLKKPTPIHYGESPSTLILQP